MRLKRWTLKAAALLLCAALAGCGVNNAAYLRYRHFVALTDYHRAAREHEAQQRTVDRLLAACRACLATDQPEALCWADLAAYRDCIEAGSGDAVCGGVVP